MPDSIPVTPAQAPNIDTGARTGMSPADIYAQRQQAQTPPASPDPSAAPDLVSALDAAKRQDAGAPTPSQQQQQPPPTPGQQPPAKPSPTPPGQQPPAPEKPSLEFRPKRPDKASQWDDLKTRHAQEVSTYAQQLETLKAELAQAKAIPATPAPEIEKLTRDLAEYRELLRNVAIERDPEFNQRFKSKSEAAITAAKLAAGDKSDKLSALLQAPSSAWRDEQISALIEDLPVGAQRRVDAALRTLEQIDIERQSEIASNRHTWEQKQIALASQSQRENAERLQKYTAAFDQAKRAWTDPHEGHPFFQVKEGDDAHNTQVNDTISLAREILSGNMSEQDLATAALWAASGRRTWEALIGAQEEVARLKADNDRLRGVVPGAGQPGAPSDGNGSDITAKPGSRQFEQSFIDQLNDAQRRDRQAY